MGVQKLAKMTQALDILITDERDKSLDNRDSQPMGTPKGFTLTL